MDNCKPIQPNGNKENGMGRLCTLKNKIHIDEAVNLVKQHTKLKFLQLARVLQSGITLYIKFN